MMKTSLFCSIYQKNAYKSCLQLSLIIWTNIDSFTVIEENNCKSCLHSNLIILTDLHSFTVNKHKLHKLVNLKNSNKVRAGDLGQNLNVTKTS